MQYSQEHLKTMVYAEFGGQTECIMGNWKIENTDEFRLCQSPSSLISGSGSWPQRSRSLAGFCRRKHKKSTAGLRAREKNWARLVGKSKTNYLWRTWLKLTTTEWLENLTNADAALISTPFHLWFHYLLTDSRSESQEVHINQPTLTKVSLWE